MTTWSDELTILRRFLRDPDANIWSDDTIRIFWNDSQMEIASKIGFIEKAHIYKYPPQWTWSYMRDWEYEYTEGDRYQCLVTWQARNIQNCYPWEPGYWLTSSDTFDDGDRFIFPWEAHYCSAADAIPIPFHEKLNKTKYLAWDEEEVTYIDRKELARTDSHYKTASGDPLYYWRLDEYYNTFVLYPRVSSVTWDDIGLPGSPLDTFDDAGGIITWIEASLDETDTGFIMETVSPENNIFSIFDALPQDVPESDSDVFEIDWPEFLVKYIRYATLERCFGVDTDGFIPSLRDLWKLRKEVGIKAMKRYKAMRTLDRDYQLGGKNKPGISRHARLPSEYSKQWP